MVKTAFLSLRYMPVEYLARSGLHLDTEDAIMKGWTQALRGGRWPLKHGSEGCVEAGQVWVRSNVILDPGVMVPGGPAVPLSVLNAGTTINHVA